MIDSNARQRVEGDEAGLTIHSAAEADLTLLAEMNKRLIDDERSRNPMTVSELRERMRGWLLTDWHIRLFNDETKNVVGYAVYQLRPDDYFPEMKIVYLRQLYIEREHRSRGLGQQALQLLIEREFCEASAVVIEVLETNPRGYHFWSKTGFEPYCTTMRLPIQSRVDKGERVP